MFPFTSCIRKSAHYNFIISTAGHVIWFYKGKVYIREVSQAYGYRYRYGYDNRIRSRQPRVGFCFANYRYMFHLSALAFIMSVFLTNMTDRDPVFYHGFIHCIFSSFCLQMTNNFLSIASTIPVKIILWEMFLIWDKNTAKRLQNSIRFSTTCMSSRISW